VLSSLHFGCAGCAWQVTGRTFIPRLALFLQGYYRGLNTSTAPRLMFKLTGASAFPTQFAFSTYLLPGSRPSLLPCHPLAPSCSVADQEAVDNVTVSGSRYITPGQRGIAPVELPVTWGRLPPEAELRVGVRIVSLSNCRVAPQGGDVAAVIFGTPPGHCPPGEGCTAAKLPACLPKLVVVAMRSC
jgi:hypothetical protein